MTVIQLAAYRQPAMDKETVAVLRYLERAAAQGLLRDVDVKFRINDQEMRAATGSYTSGQAACKAANLVSIRLNAAANSRRLPKKDPGKFSG